MTVRVVGGGLGVVPELERQVVDRYRWETLRRRPWALACERALAPIGIGLMAAGVYTLARSGVRDWATGALALLTAVVLYGRWLPPIALVLAAGFVGWIAGLWAVTSFP